MYVVRHLLHIERLFYIRFTHVLAVMVARGYGVYALLPVNVIFAELSSPVKIMQQDMPWPPYIMVDAWLTAPS